MDIQALVLVFLLAYAGGDEETRARLKGLLEFYKKNRALFRMAETVPAQGDPSSSSAGTQETDGEIPLQKSRPREEDGNEIRELDVLMRYLDGLS